MPYINTQSTVKLQEIVNIAKGFGDIEPVLNVAGSSALLPLTIANDVMNAICSVSFPWKWNEIECPQFLTNSFQQDYAGIFPNGQSMTNLSWLERGIVVDINNMAQPKPFRMVEVGRQLPQATGTFWNSATNNPLFLVNWFPNNTLYYGEWGQGNTASVTLGNNPGPGSVYTSLIAIQVLDAVWTAGQITFTLNYIPNGTAPGGNLIVTAAFPSGYNNSFVIVSVNTALNQVVVTAPTNPGVYEAGGYCNGSGGESQPANPIMQIQDENGNLLVLTQFGTEGTTAPTAPPNAAVGTTVSGNGATTIWTVVDPYGMGFRINPVPSQTGVVWQFSLWGQALPIRFKSLQQTLFPLPNQYEPNFRQMFIAQCYRYSTEAKIRAKFHDEWQLAMKALDECRTKSDRELEENSFTPDRGIMGGQRGKVRFVGGAYPFNYPIN